MATSNFTNVSNEELLKRLGDIDDQIWEDNISEYKAKTLGEQKEDIEKELTVRGVDF